MDDSPFSWGLGLDALSSVTIYLTDNPDGRGPLACGLLWQGEEGAQRFTAWQLVERVNSSGTRIFPGDLTSSREDLSSVVSRTS